MWDTRGFEKIYDDNHQALLLRYILEGRLQRENLQQALLLSDEICKKRYAFNIACMVNIYTII